MSLLPAAVEAARLLTSNGVARCWERGRILSRVTCPCLAANRRKSSCQPTKLTKLTKLHSPTGSRSAVGVRLQWRCFLDRLRPPTAHAELDRQPPVRKGNVSVSLPPVSVLGRRQVVEQLEEL